MLSNSFVGSIMNMSADVYTQQNTQDENTGAIIRGWVYSHTIKCKVEPIKTASASAKGDNKSFATAGADAGYSEKLQLKVKSTQLLSKRWRLENIKTSDNKQVFIEIDKYNQPDSIFEVYSSHAILDPFGKLAYYEAVVQRTPVQHNDKTNNRG